MKFRAAIAVPAAATITTTAFVIFQPQRFPFIEAVAFVWVLELIICAVTFKILVGSSSR